MATPNKDMTPAEKEQRADEERESAAALGDLADWITMPESEFAALMGEKRKAHEELHVATRAKLALPKRRKKRRR